MTQQRLNINQLAICANCEQEAYELNPLAIIPSAANTVRVILQCSDYCDHHIHWCDYCGIILNPRVNYDQREIIC